MSKREQIEFRLREYERRESQLNDEGMITLGTLRLALRALDTERDAARALLPTAEELAAVHRAHGSLPYDNGIAYAALKGWLARLEAARVEGER